MIKRITTVLLAIMIFISTVSLAVNSDVKAAANGTGTYVVTTGGDRLNMRNDSTTNAKLLDTIPNSTTLKVTKVSDNWGYVNYGGQNGWICLDYCEKKSSDSSGSGSSSTADSKTVSAGYADVDDLVSILRRLNELRQKFPDGRFWNWMGKSKADPDSWTNTPCPSSGHAHTDRSHCIGQCDGFARKLGLDLFGVNTSKWNTTKYDIDTVCVGDLIRYNGKHTIMVVGFTENRNELIIADCNWNCNCNIRWDASFSTSRYFRSVNWVLHFPGNTLNRETYFIVRNYVNNDTRYSTAPTTTTTAAVTTTTTVQTTAATAAAAVSGESVTDKEYTVERIGSTDRFATSLLISRKGWKDSAGTVIIANAYAYADAEASDPLAGALNAPILLTSGKNLEKDVLEQIKSLNASNVYLIGGKNVISSNIQNKLTDEGFNVVRLAGDNRFATSARIAEELKKLYGETPGTLFFVNGYSMGDILAVSSVAAVMHAPILYAPENGELEDNVAEFAESCKGYNAVIIGDNGQVSEKTEKDIIAKGAVSVKRIGGSDRYETSAMLCCEYADKFNAGAIFLTTGKDYPDALSGGAYAAALGYPVLLVNGTKAPAQVSELYSKLAPSKVYILGGKNAVSDETARAFMK